MLGAGGIRGWAHVGVIKVLHEAAVPVDLIVGASAGALIGALYAAHADPREAERIAMSFTPTDFLEWFLGDLRFSPRAGRMGRALWQAFGRREFDELPLPFAAVAFDLADHRPVVIREGSVGRAVEASIRPPIISRPISHDGRALIDGGLSNTVPVGVARELGAVAVVSVTVGEIVRVPGRLRPLCARISAASRARSSRPADLAGQFGFLAGLLARGRPPRAPADIEVRPDIRGISGAWPWHICTAMRRGEAAAREALPAIQRLAAATAAA